MSRGLYLRRAENNIANFTVLLRKRLQSRRCVLLDAVEWVPQSRPRVFVIAVSQTLDVAKIYYGQTNLGAFKVRIITAAEGA